MSVRRSEQPGNGSDPRPLLPRRPLKVGAVGVGSDGRRHYRLVARIQKGGMGELFLAEMARADGPPQRVVIKRLLADLEDEDKYIKMFRSEAAVMSRLQHPNIVKLLDTPVIERAQCLAMEFVYGRNLQQVLHRHQRAGRAFPVRMVLSIIAQVLKGLHYAHEFTEADGRPLNLVHRDVTPGNVLVGYNGSVKLTDFGIAKSKMSLVSTTVGIVKGKARYLAPEQILGEAATPRSDIFSAAVVTVELLTGEPLFERASLPKTLHAIVHGERPELSTYLPRPRPSLVQALDRALAVDLRRRPASAEAFSQLLVRAADDYGGAATTQDIGLYLQSLFHDRPPLPALGSDLDLPTVIGAEPEPLTPSFSLPRVPMGTDNQLLPPEIAEPMLTDTRPAAPMDEDNGPTHILSREIPADVAVASPSFDEAISALALVQQAGADRASATPVPRSAPRAPRRRRVLLGFAAGLAAGIFATIAVQATMRPDPASTTIIPADPPAGAASLTVTHPPGARVVLDGRPLSSAVPVMDLPLEPGEHTLEVAKARFRRTWSFRAAPGDRFLAGRHLYRVGD